MLDTALKQLVARQMAQQKVRENCYNRRRKKTDPKRPILKQEVGSLEERSMEVAIAVLWPGVGKGT